jgi:hypothetical protein
MATGARMKPALCRVSDGDGPDLPRNLNAIRIQAAGLDQAEGTPIMPLAPAQYESHCGISKIWPIVSNDEWQSCHSPHSSLYFSGSGPGRGFSGPGTRKRLPLNTVTLEGRDSTEHSLRSEGAWGLQKIDRTSHWQCAASLSFEVDTAILPLMHCDSEADQLPKFD